MKINENPVKSIEIQLIVYDQVPAHWKTNVCAPNKSVLQTSGGSETGNIVCFRPAPRRAHVAWTAPREKPMPVLQTAASLETGPRVMHQSVLVFASGAFGLGAAFAVLSVVPVFRVTQYVLWFLLILTDFYQ